MLSWRVARIPRWGVAGTLLVTGIVGADDAAAQPAPTDRVVARVNVGSRPLSRTFAATTAFTLFEEQGTYQADYQIQHGRIVDGGISFRAWRNLAVGLDVSHFRAVSPALLDSSVPHPFLFDFFRATTGRAGRLERQELVMHVSALWMMQVTDWFVVSVSGGPSLMSARQEFVSTLEHAEVGFPFDEVIIVGHTADRRSAHTIGANINVDIYTFALHRVPFLRRYRIMENIGMGLLIRYVQGVVDMTVGRDRFEVDLGGLQLTAGLRFRF